MALILHMNETEVKFHEKITSQTISHRLGLMLCILPKFPIVLPPYLHIIVFGTHPLSDTLPTPLG